MGHVISVFWASSTIILAQGAISLKLRERLIWPFIRGYNDREGYDGTPGGMAGGGTGKGLLTVELRRTGLKTMVFPAGWGMNDMVSW